MPRTCGVICLCIFLLIYGIVTVSSITFQMQNFLLGILAAVAGILILLGK